MAKSLNKYFNPNPLKKETGDCVVRAICKVTGKDWDTVYKRLCNIGLELKEMPSSDECWKKLLTDCGFKYTGVKVKKGSKRPLVEDFAKDNKKGTYVLRVANHVVPCVDGYYYDVWDSGECSMYGYWELVKD